MGKLLRRYLREQSPAPSEQDIVRMAAAQTGVDFDKLPPDIQTKLHDLITKWHQNQGTYQQLSNREAQIATQIDALANQPDTPDKQGMLNQLNNQLTSTRMGIDQIKASNAELDTAGNEIAPAVQQLRDTGQAAITPYAKPEMPSTIDIPQEPSPTAAAAPEPQAQPAPEPQFQEPGPSQAPPDIHQGTLQNIPQMSAPAHQPAPEPGVFSQALTKAGEIGGNVKDWATNLVIPPPPKGVAPPSLEPQFREPGPSQAPPDVSQMSVPAHGSSYQSSQAPPDVSKISVPAHGTPYQSAPPPPPPPTEPQFQEPGPSQAPEGGMGDAAAGAAAVGIAGAAVMGAYKIYKQFFSKAARACANAPSKDECMQSYRDHGVQAAVNNLKRQIPKCGNDQDCAQKLQMAIKKLESNLGA
jgi:cell division protein FtsB